MKLGRLLAGLALAAMVGALAFPVLWAVLSSFTPEERVFEGPTGAPVLDHYVALWRERAFWRPVARSLSVAGLTTIVCLLVGTPAAWALARLRFRGKTAVLSMVLAVTMFPQISIVSPLYMLLRSLRLIDTTPGLVLPYLTFAMPLTVWFLVGFFRALPRELEDAARVDGASRLRTFVAIVLPLSAPGIATTALLTFLYSWNEFLFALSFTTDPARHTVPVAIALFRGQYQVPWGEILAATTIASTPVALLAVVFQRRVVSGLTAGGVKG